MKYKKWELSQKLEILSESEDLGIVETCRKHGVSTGTFYSWKKKFEHKGEAGLKVKSLRKSKKSFQNYFGYKNHAKVDHNSKIITSYMVTTASVHDSQVIDNLLNEKDNGEKLYADSAYVGQDHVLQKHNIIDQIHEKGYKNSPLTETQKELNKEKSKTRARVEHVFGSMENSMEVCILEK